MQGTMIWFNLDKGFGFIRTETDERLYVSRTSFLPGHEPALRCKGREVSFERETGGSDGPYAANVSYTAHDEPRRARMRGGRQRF